MTVEVFWRYLEVDAVAVRFRKEEKRLEAGGKNQIEVLTYADA